MALFVYGVEFGGPLVVARKRVRVLCVYMNTNNGPKVSNLTVGPTQVIPSTLHHEQGAPLFTGTAPQFGDTLHQLQTSHFYTVSQQHTGDTLL